MSRRRSAAQEALKYTEEDEDIEMQDGPSEGEGEGEAGEGLSKETHQTITDLATYLCKVEEDGEELAAGFQRIPNRRVLPDYFDVISHPVAFSTVRSKLLRKGYSAFTEFVRDVAQICHNAQVYNRPSAPIFGAAQRLREIFVQELQKLVAKGKITAEEAQLPDLGEIPETEDSPPPGSDAEDDPDAVDEEEDEDEEEEEGEDEDEDSDEEGRAPRRRGRRRGSAAERKEDPDKEDDAHKKRGRPPSVLTPMEARIHSILRGLRKFKGDDGNLLILPFEKLPDKIAVPDYYQTITNPISLDQIKRKAKRKKYGNVDAVMGDVELMFNNAKLYNEDDSPVHEAAEELLNQARVLAEQEKAKPDEDFRTEDGKLPLAGIEHDGQLWKVGDWIHIRNPNDLAKPIVAQIYRTWQDRDGQRWINACWYYRPEQTVHRYEKHFFPHEVVKTGQYRDHQIEEVVDRCFVMFVTRFPKGRPRGFPKEKSVYVCESRYNEEKFRFAKIKTWASCVPDEVREKDYEMDLFDNPRRMRKTPSPIKHLLREDAKESDELPKPTWGSPNAPPIVGAVHRRPREPYESPPPEPTPPPPPAPIPQMAAQARRSSMMDASGRPVSSSFPGAAPSPSQYNTHAAQQFQPMTPGGGGMHQTPVPVPQQSGHMMRTIPYQPPFQQQGQPQQFQQQMHQQSQAGYHQGYGPAGPMQGGNAMAHNYSQHTQGGRPPMTAQGSMYNPPRPPEVYTLPDPVQEGLPAQVRDDLQRDQYGRVLFFTAPPLDRTYNGLAPESAALGHSAKYLAGRTEWLAERERKRKERDEMLNEEAAKRAALGTEDTDKNGEEAASITSQAVDAMGRWMQQLDKDTTQWKNETGLEGWREPVK